MKLTEEPVEVASKNETGETEKVKKSVPEITEARTITDDTEWPTIDENNVVNGHDTRNGEENQPADDNLSDAFDDSITLHITDDEAENEEENIDKLEDELLKDDNDKNEEDDQKMEELGKEEEDKILANGDVEENDDAKDLDEDKILEIEENTEEKKDTEDGEKQETQIPSDVASENITSPSDNTTDDKKPNDLTSDPANDSESKNSEPQSDNNDVSDKCVIINCISLAEIADENSSEVDSKTEDSETAESKEEKENDKNSENESNDKFENENDLLEPRTDYFPEEDSKDVERPTDESNSETQDVDEASKDEQMELDVYKPDDEESKDENKTDSSSESKKTESEEEQSETVIEEIEKILNTEDDSEKTEKRKKKSKKLARCMKSKKDKSPIEKWGQEIINNIDTDDIPLTQRIKLKKKRRSNREFLENEAKSSSDDEKSGGVIKKRRISRNVNYADLEARNSTDEEDTPADKADDKMDESDIPESNEESDKKLSDSESNQIESESTTKDGSSGETESVEEERKTVVKSENDSFGNDVKPMIKKETGVIQEEEVTGSTGRKRFLEAEDDTMDMKKPKIDLDFKVKIEKKEYVPLNSFKELLSNLPKFSRKNLEEFCIQKICEIISKCSELGELKQKVRKQEKEIEAWRAKYTSINKQARDLEIVKTRVISDMKNREKEGLNPNDANPIKITRSVGLQVGLQTTVPPRRTSIPSNPSTPTPAPQLTPPAPQERRKPVRPPLPLRTPNAPTTPNRTPTPQKQVTVQKTVKTILPVRPAEKDQSILNKALQKQSAKKPETKGVIDLTDEDENNTQTKETKPTVPSGIRIVTSAVPTTIATPTSLVATTAPGTRLTYLVTNGPGGQPGQPLILHNFPAPSPTRPQVRQVMFKPLAPNNSGPRSTTIRLPGGQPVVVSQASRSPQIRVSGVQPVRPPASRQITVRHPAPLPGPPPLQPSQPTWKAMPPRPSLKISRVGEGIVLSWKILAKDLSAYEEIASYQLFAYQETTGVPNTEMWRKVGDVKALALPMACTLTQFTGGHKYHFAVRAVDVKSRVGPFSPPEQITLS